MDILFIGSLYPDDTFESLRQANIPVGFAAQVFQKAILSGLDNCCDIQVVSEVTMPSYPKCKMVVRAEEYSHDGEHQDRTIPYLNLPGIRMISKCISYIKEVRRREQYDCVLVYEVTSRHLLSALFAKNDCKKILIVPDLPEYMSDNKNPLYLLAKKIDGWIIKRLLNCFDGYVLFSSLMSSPLNIKDKPYIVVEGVFNTSLNRQVAPKNHKKVLFYSGKIEKWFGLEDLLEAFTLTVNEDFELWLCGNGDIEMLDRFQKRDTRIKYLGMLPYEEVLRLQQEATILVNPRHSGDMFTRYSFPSKTMEYMASGTPTLMCHLKSIPREYDDYIFYFEDESISGMANRIEECLSMTLDLLDSMGRKAKQFIIENKSSNVQGRKVYDFIMSL